MAGTAPACAPPARAATDGVATASAAPAVAPLAGAAAVVAPPAGGAWEGAANILCVRLDNLGDVLMCTPAMRAIARHRPARRLTLLTSPGAAGAVPFIPELDAALGYAAPWVKGPAPVGGATVALLRRLRAARFDGAVIFTSYSQSALPAALLCQQAGIPLRLAHCRENPYALLSDWVEETEPAQGIRHEVRRQLALVGAIGCRAGDERLSFAVRGSDLDWMRQLLGAELADQSRPWVLMHPGASAPSRRYPPAHWAGVLRRLVLQQGLPVVLTGDAGEASLIASIIGDARLPGARSVDGDDDGNGNGDRIGEASAAGGMARSLAGRLDLGKLAAAIALAPVLVSNNTGPAHLAAALGTPVVDLYALTNPQHTPWRVASRVLFHDVPCRYCYKSVCPQGHHRCLSGVEPERVVEAILSLLARRRAVAADPVQAAEADDA
nr:glycosyltransferase family 9 protein [uncultured Duganella sp.]